MPTARFEVRADEQGRFMVYDTENDCPITLADDPATPQTWQTREWAQEDADMLNRIADPEAH